MALSLLILILFVLPFTRAFATNNATKVCAELASKISNDSAVLYQSNANFTADIHHWFQSSSQIPACVLEVGSAKDTSIALQILGRTRTPFAVESGGHASNPGFSSTTGVHISLKRLNQVSWSKDKSTVTIGMGQTWVEVYEILDGSGVNVVGGRTSGPGIGGFTLGGGFSWKTNQYGLTCDTVRSFTLVLPEGTVSTIDSSQSELFFALKGGLNRFGIVTSAVFSTHQQSDLVYGGFNFYSPDETEAVLNATTQFYQENTDPKAQIITTLSGSLLGTTTLVLFFYDGPTPPASFDTFESIVPLTLLKNVRTQSFSSFVSSIPSKLAVNPRGTFDTLSTSSLTPRFVQAVKEEADTNSQLMALHGGLMTSYDIEPFLPSYGDKATNSAYPHVESPLPLNVYFAWTFEIEDSFWCTAMRASVQRLVAVAKHEGIYVDTKYPNYAATGTSAESLYGVANAGRLSSIRDQIDAGRVMDLAGGFDV